MFVGALVDQSHTWLNGRGILRPRRQANTMKRRSIDFGKTTEVCEMMKTGRPGKDEVFMFQVSIKHRS